MIWALREVREKVKSPESLEVFSPNHHVEGDGSID